MLIRLRSIILMFCALFAVAEACQDYNENCNNVSSLMESECTGLRAHVVSEQCPALCDICGAVFQGRNRWGCLGGI